MNSFRLFPHLDLAGRVSQLRFFDQVITPAVEPENSHLIAPFNLGPPLLFGHHLAIVWHKHRSYQGANVLSAPL